MRLWNLSLTRKTGKLKKFSDFWFVLKHDISSISCCLTPIFAKLEFLKVLRNLRQCFLYLLGFSQLNFSDNRDVAIIFHAHCLSPFRYYTDILHRTRRHQSNLWSRGLAFPLERLHGLIANGTWSDEQSQLLWESAYNVPYQLWSADPALGAELQLQNVAFSCPWCHRIGTINLDQFTQTHVSKTAVSNCGSCGRQFNADNLSAQYLKQDLTGFSDGGRSMVSSPDDNLTFRIVKGAISGTHGSTSENARADLQIILKTVLKPLRAAPTSTNLAIYIKTR